MAERAAPALAATRIDCNGSVFAEILRWSFRETFVARLLAEDIPQRVAFHGCQIMGYLNREREIVGFGTIEISGEYQSLTGGRPHPYLPLLAVSPGHQGKGYGTAIVNHLVLLASHFARAGKCHDVLFLDVYESSTAAIHLYRKCGFETMVADPLDDPIERKRYFVMARRVSTANP